MNLVKKTSKTLHLPALVLLTWFFCQVSSAQVLLTGPTEKIQSGKITVEFPVSSDPFEQTAKLQSTVILKHIENTLVPSVPNAILQKFLTQEVHIQIKKNLGNKKGLFIDPHSSGEKFLILQLNESFLRDPTLIHTLTHEWFHALHFVIHPDEPSWLREGLAQLYTWKIHSHSYTNFSGITGVSDSLEKLTAPLEYVFDIKKEQREAYGHTFLYFLYLFRQCGGNELFWKIAESAPGHFGEKTIDRALEGAARKECSTFLNSATYFEIARVHNKKNSSNDLYSIVPSSSLAPLASTQLPSFEFLKQLQRFTPVVFKGDQTFRNSLTKLISGNSGLRAFTLSRNYPYDVNEGIQPFTSQRDDWILIIRTQ